ncbi:MAG: sensor histidine kinase [Bacteroidales bacterium]|jgi:two-component system LytT family sensor kinase|nr:sensor histidine kinase [Bacteroidales bacterium]
MKIKKLNNTIPLSKLLWFVLGIAIGVQFILITYNHFSGFYPLSDFKHFLLRLLRGSILSFVAGLIIVLADLFFISFLNRVFSWSNKLGARIAFQFMGTVLFASVVSFGFTGFAQWLNPYTESLVTVFLYNALIFSVVNLVIVTILEAWMYFLEGIKAKDESKALKEELSQIQFEVLKSQINPHFMFNSLNVLSGLISQDVKKAQDFIDEFAFVYRYVLESIEQPVRALNREMEFARSYLFLQQIRYGDGLKYSVEMPADCMSQLLPPLSLQVVLENSIKHNIVDAERPLIIEISCHDGELVVINNIQLKISTNVSTGVGLQNLKKRYTFVSEKAPVFYIDNNHYIAKLPLIKAE